MIDNVPAELKQARQWVCWKQEPRPGKKPAKKPFRPWGPRPTGAKSNDPGTWGTYDQAIKHAANGGSFDGIGLMFANDLVGIDLDDVVKDEQIEPWALEIIEQANSYTEYSTSGTGLHILARGALPSGRRRRGQVEMYDKTSPRFFVMTGNIYNGRDTIHPRQAEIETIHATHLGQDDDTPPAPPVATPGTAASAAPVANSGDILQKGLAANANFAALWRGDTSSYQGDTSRADLALCRHLAFWYAKDPATIDEMFRQSALMRTKWDEKHGAHTYGQMTISKAIATTTKVYTPPAAPGPRPQASANQRPNLDTRNPKTDDFFKAFEWLRYEFRLNLLDDTIEVNGEPINAGLEARLKNKMRDIGLGNTARITDAYMELAFDNGYNPIMEYLDKLQWDGKDDISHLATHYLTDTTKFAPIALKRWMIGSVAKIYEQAQNFMLVLDGPQGAGKSRFTRWLCPLPQFFMEGPIKPDDKDYLLRMATSWVWEVAELQATTRKADREALKSVLTMQEITLRKAYTKYDITKPAITSFVGTINEDGAGFLTDTTGNRRYVIIRIERFNWDYEKELNIANLWAQAVALYRAGEPWKLTDQECLVRDAINEQYQQSSVVAITFFEHYDVNPDKRDVYATIHDILTTLRNSGLTGNQQALMGEVSRLMKQLGAEPFRARQGTARPTAYRGVYLR